MNTTDSIKVLIADDSAFMRLLIQQIITTDPTIEVVGKANDGHTAYLKTEALRPDVVLMDLTMGDYDGRYGVAQIMEHCPTPIIMLSAMGNVDMAPILETLALGAIGYVNKPANNRINMQEVKQVLLDKIKMASRVELTEVSTQPTIHNNFKHSFDANSLAYDCIVIGASTGGPRAIEHILTQLPENLAVPVFIVQHIPASFAKSFAARLNGLTPLEVQLATIGESPQTGGVYIASGQGNLIVKRKGKRVYFKETEEQSLHYNNPSVDMLMLSVAKIYKNRAIGCVLTGMGRDGAVGLKAIQSAGGYTLAQNEASCIVFGMPKAAQNIGAATKMVHLNDIAGFLVSCLS
ncbi:MAG: chemotaxis-specific protein-glutamate methyltransferase CheB [Aureispira sp.]